MKTHKIKHGGDFTINGIDETFITYCGLTENVSENMQGCFVRDCEPCSCKTCNKHYQSQITKQLTKHKKNYYSFLA